MNIVYISYGHVDPSSALVKYLEKRKNKIIFIIVGYGNRFINSIIDFDLSNLHFGLHKLDFIRGQSIDCDNLLNYLKDVDSYFLKLPSRSFKDFSNIKYIKKVTNLINIFNPDVVHFSGDSALQIYFYMFLKKYPLVLTIHDFIPHTGESSKFNLRNKIFRFIHYHCKYQFILHSRYHCELMSKTTNVKNNKINTIYFAPFDFFDYYNVELEKEDFPSVLFFGRISMYKGLKHLFESIPRIIESIPDCRFYILGDGKFENDISQYLKKYPITLINKFIDNQTLSNYIKKSSIVILPYTDASQSAVIFTAYAFDKPVIATRVGGIPEVVDNDITGILIEPSSGDEISAAVISVFENKDIINFMSNKIKELKIKKEINYMSWDIAAKETEDVYKKAIAIN